MGIFDKFEKINTVREIKTSAITTCFDIVNEFELIDTKIYFDDRFIYTDEKGVKYQIQYVIMNKYTGVNVCINDKVQHLSSCNIAICTLVEMKMKKYAEQFSVVTKKK